MDELEEIKKFVEDYEKKVKAEVEVPLYDKRNKMSVERFSEVNKPLRRGLRHLYRAWSASVDGFPEEAREMKALGVSEIEEAKKLLEES